MAPLWPRGANDVELIEQGFEEVLHERSSNLAACLVNESGDRDSTGPVNTHEEVELAFSGQSRGDVDMDDPIG